MAEEFVEKIRYEADISDVQAKLNKLAGEQGQLSTSTGDVTGKMGGHWDKVKGKLDGFVGGLKTAGLGLLGVGAAAIAFGPQLLSAGAELDALGKKAATVFDGAALGQVQAWASGVAGSLGMTRDELVGTTAGVADLLKPMGFATDEAAKMSTGLVDLSGALSAWTGGTRSAKEVSDILTKALLGERDGLKELGISISEADVQARLAKNGTDKLTGAALEQAKALATQQLIMEKSTDAQKAWSNGSMDAIKQQNESKAAIANLSEVVTRLLYPALQAILPPLSNLAEWAGEKLPGAFATMKEVLTDVFEGGKQIVEDMADAFGTSSGTIVKVLAGVGVALVAVAVAWNAGPGLVITLIAALVAGFAYAYTKVDWFRAGVQTAFAAVKVTFDAVVQAGGWVVDKMQAIWSKSEGLRGFLSGAFALAWAAIRVHVELLTAAGGAVVDKLQAIWSKSEGVRNFFAGVFSAGIGVARSAFNDLLGPIKWVIEQLDKVFKTAKSAYDMAMKIPSTVKGAVKSGVGGVISSVIPGLHNGGVVDGLPSGEVITKLLVGETVRTRSQEAALQSRMGGVQIGTLNVTTSDSPRRFFDEGLWRVAG